jgi:hypothetical protein
LDSLFCPRFCPTPPGIGDSWLPIVGVVADARNSILARWATGNSRDPLALLAGALLLTIVAAAWHASNDPMTALRCE